MKNVTRTKDSQGVRPARLAASALAIAAVVAGAAAGSAAARGTAAPAIQADRASQLHGHAALKEPKLRHGLLTIEGSGASDRIALRLKAGQPDTLQVDFGDDGSADFSFARADVARIAVAARAGDDLVRVDESNGSFTDGIPTTIDGGDGKDDLRGGSGAETLLGGEGNDTIDGNRGNDLALMGAGDDTFVWDPGDGSDIVEGQDGADTMLFNGANVAERFDLSANGGRLRFFRDVGTITIDTNDVETVDVRALGGADTITVGDLTGTDVTSVKNDLAATGGGGDGQADHVIVNGTNGADAIAVSGAAGSVHVTGLAAAVNATDAEPALDTLTVNAQAGADVVDASGLAATSIKLELNGGDDADRLIGSAGGDLVNGGRAADVALLGADDDTFVWNPGDGSDVVEGQAGADTMVFNGANVNERFDLSANGNRLRFFRDIASITMDTAGVERIDVNALGGADLVSVNDLHGTGVSKVNVDLAGALGSGAGDGQPDRVVVTGTNGNDAIDVSGAAGGVDVSGLAVAVGILHAEAANDRLEIDTLTGRDTVSPDGLAAGVIQLFVNGMLVP